MIAVTKELMVDNLDGVRSLTEELEEPLEECCNKELGKNRNMRLMSRGHLVAVGGSGIIADIHPIFKYANYLCLI